MSENKDDVAEPKKLESMPVLQGEEEFQEREIRVEQIVEPMCGGFTPEERAIVKGGSVDTLLQGLRAQIESSVASDGSVFEPMTYTVRRRSVATAHKRRRRRRSTTLTRCSLLVHCNPTHVTIDGLPPPFRRISYFLPQSQVVAGTNYRCKVKTAAGTVNVSVFESLDGVANLSGCSAGPPI